MSVQFDTAATARNPNADEGAATALPQFSQSAKRVPRADGVDAWYPYYAGFSTRFARSALEALALAPGSHVLDPWNGGGTTTFVARSLGLRATGLDLNPFATLLATAKMAALLNPRYVRRRFESLSRTLFAVGAEDLASFGMDPLRPWLGPTAGSFVRRCARASLERSPVSSLRALHLLCVIRAARELGVRRASNPTWTRPTQVVRLSRTALISKTREIFGAMAADFAAGRCEPAAGDARILTADARSMPLADSSVDVILTSPPYCTRIDYAITTAFELAALGHGERDMEFGRLRRELMGTVALRASATRGIPATWAPAVGCLLESIRSHGSYSSSGYYFKNIWQYFDDAHRALAEASRVLRRRGRAMLVLQSSYYKEIEIDLPLLYVEMARQVGLDGRVVQEQPVNCHFSRIQRNGSNRRKVERRYRESIVVLEKA